jgi:hypothetical protein
MKSGESPLGLAASSSRLSSPYSLFVIAVLEFLRTTDSFADGFEDYQSGNPCQYSCHNPTQ